MTAVPAATAIPTRLRAPTSRRRLLAVSAVVLGHLGVLLIVWEQKFASVPSGEARRVLTTLRLIPQRQPPAPAPAPRPVPRAAVAPRELVDRAASGETRSTIVPAAPDTSGPPDGGAGAGAHAAAAPGTAASGPAKLSLQPSREVLRGALVNPAIEDPRSNSPRPTFEERIAMGLDPDVCIKLERLPDGTVRRTLSRLVDAESLLQASHGVGAKGARVCK